MSEIIERYLDEANVDRLARDFKFLLKTVASSYGELELAFRKGRVAVYYRGNSLAVRIPKSFAEEVGLREESPVDLSLHQRGLLLEPSAPRPPALEELLGKVRRSNIHTEVDMGPAQGAEAW
jgi:antitoxin MazE